jgi:hypothetical protein
METTKEPRIYRNFAGLQGQKWAVVIDGTTTLHRTEAAARKFAAAASKGN